MCSKVLHEMWKSVGRRSRLPGHPPGNSLSDTDRHQSNISLSLVVGVCEERAGHEARTKCKVPIVPIDYLIIDEESI
jgi:hypothetical protein